jgi:hypothetical protein
MMPQRRQTKNEWPGRYGRLVKTRQDRTVVIPPPWPETSTVLARVQKPLPLNINSAFFSWADRNDVANFPIERTRRRSIGASSMRSYLKRLGAAALAVGLASLAISSTADARIGGFHHYGGFHGFHGGHWRGVGFGFAPAFAGALAFGALSAPYYYGAPVAYYDDCFPRPRIVGYTAWGRPIVRIVRACW